MYFLEKAIKIFWSSFFIAGHNFVKFCPSLWNLLVANWRCPPFRQLQVKVHYFWVTNNFFTRRMVELMIGKSKTWTTRLSQIISEWNAISSITYFITVVPHRKIHLMPTRRLIRVDQARKNQFCIIGRFTGKTRFQTYILCKIFIYVCLCVR